MKDIKEDQSVDPRYDQPHFVERSNPSGASKYTMFLFGPLKSPRHLKVVTNEKRGGSGSWLVFGDGFGPWRSMSVYFLMLPSSFLGSISVSFL
jgi:hypothetical protein